MSLVELMVSLTIGLFLMAGAMSVFMAASQTGVRKTEADQALEAFRFSQFIISRVARQASGVNTSTATSLVLAVPAGVDGCIGETNTAARTNTFAVSNGSLQCTASGSTQSLVENLSSVGFTYGVDANADNRVSQSEFIAAGSVTDWTKVESILVTVTALRGTVAGLKTSFVVTVRSKALS
jgi:Tfp pilus assembly protein PilW